VETAAQAAALLELGCTIQQGYYFSRPLPADAFEAMLARRARLPLTPAAGG
jgi:EAL domain-containing protein (putative c-di-GMP-specific phosphodiesterase class I)